MGDQHLFLKETGRYNILRFTIIAKKFSFRYLPATPKIRTEYPRFHTGFTFMPTVWFTVINKEQNATYELISIYYNADYGVTFATDNFKYKWNSCCNKTKWIDYQS